MPHCVLRRSALPQPTWRRAFPPARLPRPLHTTPCTATASRRHASLLLLLPIVALPFRDPGPAAAADLTLTPVAPVRPALTPTQYLDRIQTYQAPAFQTLADLLDRNKFKEAAEALVLFPVDDLVQSAFYLPWAVLALDEQSAIKVQEAYNVFEDKLFVFRALCREAASYRAEDEEVLAALADMQLALNALVASAP